MKKFAAFFKRNNSREYIGWCESNKELSRSKAIAEIMRSWDHTPVPNEYVYFSADRKARAQFDHLPHIITDIDGNCALSLSRSGILFQ